MEFAPKPVYIYHPEIWIFCDARDLEGAEELHRLRALFQADGDLRAFGPDHFIVVVKPGGARRLLT